MKKKIYIIAMIAGLSLWGCSQEDKQAEAPTTETKPTVEQAMDKAKEAAVAVVTQVEKATDAVEKNLEQQTAAVEKKVEEQTAAVEKKLDQQTEAIAEKMEQQTAAVATKAEQQTEAAATKIEQQTAAVVEKSNQVATEGKTATDKLTTTVESVVIENKKGKVVLAHKKHAESFGCAACHGDQEPGPLTLGKDAAHALCQGCHKEKKAGPTTNCTQCHQKKDKAVEGC